MVAGWKKSFPTSTSEVEGMSSPVAVNVTGDPVSPVAEAVAVLGPATGPSVSTADAAPLAKVVAAGGAMVPFPAVTAHVTFVPATALPNWSLTVTWNGAGSASPTVP